MVHVGRFELVLGPRWSALVDELARLLPDVLTSPFSTARVVVNTPATGKVASQHVAARLGISAGIAFQTPGQMERELAERAGVARDRARWTGTPLDLAVLRAMDESPSPLVRRALASPRPGQRRATASRVAQVFRHYARHAPGLVEAWLAGDDEGPDGPLPDHAAWQPGVLREALTLLEVDPGELALAINEQAEEDPTPTFLLAIDEVTSPQSAMFAATGRGAGLVALALSPGWASGVATHRRVLSGDPPTPPKVSVHDSHGPARQVEVLRDELVRAFAEDPTLQPRDALIVCPQPRRYAHLLDAAFADQSHPGAQLRLQSTAAVALNPVLDALAHLLLISDTRATASQVIDLLLRPPLAHRWHLGDGQALRELAAATGIRWGLDASHRGRFDLAGITQNTWMRGLDRLLAGLAAGQTDANLGLTGVGAVQSSDMDLLGSLAELLSRLRRLAATTDSSTTVEDWVSRARTALADLVGPPTADEWQVIHAHATLTRMARDHAGDEATLTRHEFAHMLTASDTRPPLRVAAGNGSLQVAGLDELVHAEHRLVAMLGLTDDVLPGPAGIPDAIAIPGAPDPRQRRLRHLLAQARSAERLIVVQQGFSSHTGRRDASPVAVAWLLRQLNATATPIEHPAVSTAVAAFTGKHPSFDAPALAGALARGGRVPLPSPAQRRRQAARHEPLPGKQRHEVTLSQLARFLEDPARAFLRARGGITRYQDPEVSDEIPIRVDGLARWKVIDETLATLRRGDTVDDMQRRIWLAETLPPREIGRVGFEAALEDARRLWNRAKDTLSLPTATVAIDLTFGLGDLGEVRLLDHVTIHGETAVHMTPSSSDTRLIAAWLDCLALAASEKAHAATLLRFAPWPSKGQAETVILQAPPEPLVPLAAVARAWVVGQARLLPIPPEPGIVFARQARTRVDPRTWQGPLGDFRGPWPRLGESWPLFYDDDLAELVSDEVIDTDPVNGQSRAFPAWASELYGPLIGGMMA